MLVAVVVVPFWTGFPMDNWNCMRITRYVVTAPTICKIIRWWMSLKSCTLVNSNWRGMLNSCSDAMDVQNRQHIDSEHWRAKRQMKVKHTFSSKSSWLYCSCHQRRYCQSCLKDKESDYYIQDKQLSMPAFSKATTNLQIYIYINFINLYMCSGWYTNWVTWQHARYNNENTNIEFNINVVSAISMTWSS